MPRVKKKPYVMPEYNPTEEEEKAYQWGVSEGIIISPLGINNNPNEWHIGISNHWRPKEVKKDPKVYGRDEIWPKVYEYYMYYYEKKGLPKTE